MAEKFIPYRCSECKNGEYLWADRIWDCMCDAANDEECEKLFEDDSEV